MNSRRSAGLNRKLMRSPCHFVGGQLNCAGHVGCEVGKDLFDIGKIKAARDVLRGIVENHGHVDRECTEHLV
jgi:hypothetical protein